MPSFAQAGQSLAQTYSRVFSSDQVRRAMARTGFDGTTETATASPIASSSVVLIETQAPSAAAAVRAADSGVAALTASVSGLLDNTATIAATRATLRSAYEDQAAAEAARNALEEKKVKPGAAVYLRATADLGVAQATVAASRQLLNEQVDASVAANGLRPLTSGHVVSSTSSQRFEVRGALGAIGGLVLWLVLALLRSRPLRGSSAPLRRTAG